MDEPRPELLDVLGRSRELGFLGPGELSPQIDHARGFLEAIGDSESVLDLGSGGGLPGLVIAAERPELRMVLLDANGRRCTFLESAVDQLDLGRRVRVVNSRAEDAARDGELRGRFDAVVSRSFGPPATTAECAVGFLRRPGSLIAVSEPPDDDPSRWPESGLELLGLETHRVLRLKSGRIQVIKLVSEVSDRFPRRVGIPTKRPLF